MHNLDLQKFIEPRLSDWAVIYDDIHFTNVGHYPDVTRMNREGWIDV